MNRSYKPKVYLTSNVFSKDQLGSNEKLSEEIRFKIKNLWQKLSGISKLKFYNGRFPSEENLKDQIENFNPEFIGCHLSHSISSEILRHSNILAVSTSTAGYNHIQTLEEDNILITHTPGVLQETVADYTIAIIMTSLRNLINLHEYVWNYKWTVDDKWDLDQNLSSMLSNKTLGIVGLGEIGKEIVKKLYSWGIDIIYQDIKRNKEFEKQFPSIKFKKELSILFKESDIVSLHVPLNKQTKHLVNRDLLKLMKKDALLVNTARGPIVDLYDLLNMLENNEIKINLALDVFPEEPIDNEILDRLKKIKEKQPNLKMLLLPHNASADADTRGKMNIIFLNDIIHLIESTTIDDLREVHLIPKQKKQLYEKQWKIFSYWDRK